MSIYSKEGEQQGLGNAVHSHAHIDYVGAVGHSGWIAFLEVARLKELAGDG